MIRMLRLILVLVIGFSFVAYGSQTHHLQVDEIEQATSVSATHVDCHAAIAAGQTLPEKSNFGHNAKGVCCAACPCCTVALATALVPHVLILDGSLQSVSQRQPPLAVPTSFERPPKQFA